MALEEVAYVCGFYYAFNIFNLEMIRILIISSSKLENENFQFPCKSSIAKLTKTLNLNGLFVCFIDYNCLLMNISCDSSAL